MNENIYISSLAFTGKQPEEIIEIALRNNWAIEFSSGMPFRADMDEFYLQAEVRRMPHNYFPSPEVPFVLNLASANKSIRETSILHCKKLLQMAKQSSAPFYAAHAGFCIDPDPNELGNKINYRPDFDKSKHWQIFIDSINVILKTADELQVDFLIENNVIAPFNTNSERINPLLCCESSDIQSLFNIVKHDRFGLLLDTAHLRVSCQTLNLDIEAELNKITPFIKALHHSNNDGNEDNNQPLDNSYWFLPFMHQYKKMVHVIEVKRIDEQQIHNQINILHESYGC